MAQIKEGQGIRAINKASTVYGHSELLTRMSRLIELLEPHQRNYHLCLRINIYWYIEKHKEIEVLQYRLARQSDSHLRHYLDELCQTISQRIDEDERVASEFLDGKHTSK